MAIDSNKSDKAVIADRKLFTGLANFNVVAVNPSMDELKAMKINAQKEPEYVTMVDAKENVPAHKKIRLDFYLATLSPEIRTKMSIWIEDTPRVNKAGDKNEWINKFASSCWSAIGTEPGYDWFKKEGHHIARIGEVQLHQFLLAWANVASGKTCQLETMSKIADGDVKELKDLVVALKENFVKVLLGVTEGQNGERYQAVYTGHFGRSYQTPAGFVKALSQQGGEFKADYGDSLDLKTYSYKLSEPDKAPAADAGANPAPLPATGISF